MKLDYSLNNIDSLFLPGKWPFSDTSPRKVKVSIGGTFHGQGPSEIRTIGDLVCFCRENEYAVTLLLEYPNGTIPPSNKPIKVSSPFEPWGNSPGSVVFSQIRIALNQEAIDQIREVSGEGYDFELDLNAEFIDKTIRS